MPVTSSRCPVPPDQLPINQYQDMSESWFYSWGSRKLWPYLKPVLVTWLVSWAIAWPVTAASFAPGKHLLPFLLWASTGALIIPMLTLAQLYIGWLHIGQRLQRQEVPYEESGWYDGHIWLKPEAILSRDRLIMTYEVRPILQRVRNTLGALLALGVVLITAWRFL